MLARHVHPHGLENLARRAIVGAGVHEAGTAHGGGDAPQRLHAGEALASGGERHVAQQSSRLGRHAPMRCIHFDARKVVAQQYDDAADAAVAHQQIGAVAHNRHGHAARVASVQHAHEGIRRARRDQHVGRSADLERGVLAHGLGHKDVVLARNLRQNAQHLFAHVLMLVHRDTSPV